MIVTIDGPAGSGKSTAARKLAARLEVAYLDTGAMYRAIAYAGLNQSISWDDDQGLLSIAQSMDLELDCGPTHTRVRLNGHDISEAIRSMAVSAATTHVARHPGIRAILVEQQRRIGCRLGSFVSEGRDQGSVVFPEADVKIVLDAALEKRAQRRFQELASEGEDRVRLADVLENLKARDLVDSKQWEPLLTCANAIQIDTTQMSISEVVDHVVSIVRAKFR